MIGVINSDGSFTQHHVNSGNGNMELHIIDLAVEVVINTFVPVAGFELKRVRLGVLSFRKVALRFIKYLVYLFVSLKIGSDG